MARRRRKALLDAAIGKLAVGLFQTAKRLDRRRMANLAGAALRRAGPWLKENRIGRDNLRAAFPEKSEREIEQILAGVWDNLGRMAIEFMHLEEFRVAGSGDSSPNAVMLSPETAQRYERIRKSGQPVIAFASHLANWELSAVVVKQLGFPSAVLYRPPNIRPISEAVTRLRTPLMGELVQNGLAAPVRLARLLQAGVHVGMLVDQHDMRGVEVTFFGRPARSNPLLAMLARQTGCAIHGLRVVRLPDGNSFWGELSEAVEPVRDAQGGFDIQGTMQAINTVIEGWVREHPEQWLWLHRRWR